MTGCQRWDASGTAKRDDPKHHSQNAPAEAAASSGSPFIATVDGTLAQDDTRIAAAHQPETGSVAKLTADDFAAALAEGGPGEPGDVLVTGSEIRAADGRVIRLWVVRRETFKHPLVEIRETFPSGADLPGTNASRPKQKPQRVEYVADHVMLKPRKDASEQDVVAAVRSAGGWIAKKARLSGLLVARFEVREAGDADRVRARIERSGAVEYAELDGIVRAMARFPNDPDFSQLYGMHNTGQTGGAPDADIDAPEAWAMATGTSTVVVAVIDTGIDHLHPDLAANIWTNPGEVPGDGMDNDGNGFADDVRGWNFYADNPDARDDHFHGTHCAGTIGAVGNNGVGVAGVCWTVRLMPLKFLNAEGSGTELDAVEAIYYSTRNGATLSSNSWGGGLESRAIGDAVADASAAGKLFVAAAGNSASDNDRFPTFPANHPYPNVVSVASTTNTDALSSFSNFGKSTVHIGAPGSQIYSTFPIVATPAMSQRGWGPDYGTLNGTSMATPHVAGALALMYSMAAPGTDFRNLRSVLLAAADTPSTLADKVANSRRLNVARALSSMGVTVAEIIASDNPADGAIGNADGIPNPGERIAVRVRVQNTRSVAFDGVSASLAFSLGPDPKVSIVSGTATYGRLEPGAVSWGTGPFLVQIASDTVTPRSVPFLLSFSAEGGDSWSSPWELRVRTSASVSGRVTDAANGLPLAGAAISYIGPDGPGTPVFTGTDGLYSFLATDGTYQVKAGKSGYFEAPQVQVVVPPSATHVDFALGVSRFEIAPSALDGQALLGAVATGTMTISNGGSAPLSWTVEPEVLGPLSGGRGTILRSFDIPFRNAESGLGGGLAWNGEDLVITNIGLGDFHWMFLDPATAAVRKRVPVALSGVDYIYGLDFDGTHYWGAHTNGRRILKISVSGTAMTLAGEVADEGFFNVPLMVTRFGSYLWILNQNFLAMGDRPAFASKLMGSEATKAAEEALAQAASYGKINVREIANGSLAFGLDLPGGEAALAGLTQFGSHIWALGKSGTMYKMSPSNGHVLDQFRAGFSGKPSAYLRGLSPDGNGNFWTMDLNKAYLISSGESPGWLQAAVSGGTVLPGQAATLAVTMDSRKSGLGVHSGVLHFYSDDPGTPRVDVPVTFRVTRNEVGNNPPIAFDGNATVAMSGSAGGPGVAIQLSGTDADGDTLVYSLVTPPAHGSVSGTPPSLTYVPTAGYYGPDSFTFKANDGLVDSALATVRVDVIFRNTPPVVSAGPSVSPSPVPAPGATATLSASAHDPDGFPLASQSWVMIQGPVAAPTYPSGQIGASIPVVFPSAGTYRMRFTALDKHFGSTSRELDVVVQGGVVASVDTVSVSGSLSPGSLERRMITLTNSGTAPMRWSAWAQCAISGGTSGALVRTVNLGNGVKTPRSVAFADDDLWVFHNGPSNSANFLSKIEPRSGAVLESIALADTLTGWTFKTGDTMAWDGQRMWMTFFSNANLYGLHLAARQLDVIQSMNSLPGGTSAIGWGNGFLWYFDTTVNKRLYRLETQYMSVEDSLAAPASILPLNAGQNGGFWRSPFAPLAGRLWFAPAEKRKMVRFDPGAGTSDTEFPIASDLGQVSDVASDGKRFLYLLGFANDGQTGNLRVYDSGQISWARPIPSGGTVPPGGSVQVALEMDSRDIPTGTYSGTFNIHTLDFARRRIEIPVSLTVAPGASGNRVPQIVTPASASPATVTLPVTSSTLSFVASDPDGTPLLYTWTQLSGPGSASFSVASGTNLTSTVATLPALGEYLFAVEASDGNASVKDYVSVTFVGNPATAPVISSANVTPSPAQLSGTATGVALASDPDGDPLTYEWSKVSGLGTVTFSPSGPQTSGSVAMTFSAIGDYVVRVTARDLYQASTRDVNVRVVLPPENQGVFAWGWAQSGRLSLPDVNGAASLNNYPSPTPLPHAGIDAWRSMGLGLYHGIAIRGDGTLEAWGTNDNYQLGSGTLSVRYNAPITVSGVQDVAIVYPSRTATLVMRSNGSLWGWGYNGMNEMGGASAATQVQNPVQILAPGEAAGLATGWQHVLALKPDGTVLGWGYNFYGQVGRGTSGSSSTSVPTPQPVLVAGGTLSNVRAVFANNNLSFALKNDGTLWAWGQQQNGSLGNGLSSGVSSLAIRVGMQAGTSILPAIAEVYPGAYHCLVRDTSGQVWGFGQNSNGQLGLGNNASQLWPVRLPAWDNTVQIACGDLHTLGLRADGTVIAAGRNGNGQLGLGNTTDVNTPTLITGLSGISRVFARYNQSFALAGSGLANQPPFVRDDAFNTGMANPVSVTFNGVDPEGDPVSFEIEGGPDHGTLTGSGFIRTYTPRHGFVGTDEIRYRASDGRVSSRVATLQISVTVTPGSETTYAAWAARRFSPEDRADANKASSIWGMQADPDGDGVRNLIEFAFGSEPWIPGDTVLPSLRTETTADIRYLVFRYRRSPAASAAQLDYLLQLSEDLAQWVLPPPGLVEERLMGQDGNFVWVEARVPMSALTGRSAYMRMMIRVR